MDPAVPNPASCSDGPSVQGEILDTGSGPRWTATTWVGKKLGDQTGKRKEKGKKGIDLLGPASQQQHRREKARRVRSVWRAADRAVGPLSARQLEDPSGLIRSGTRQGQSGGGESGADWWWCVHCPGRRNLQGLEGWSRGRSRTGVGSCFDELGALQRKKESDPSDESMRRTSGQGKWHGGLQRGHYISKHCPARLVRMHFGVGLPGGRAQNSRAQHGCLPIFMIRRRRTPISLGPSLNIGLPWEKSCCWLLGTARPIFARPLRPSRGLLPASTVVDWLGSVRLSAPVDTCRSLDARLRRRAVMFACRAGGGDGQDREADEVTDRLVGPRPARTVRSGAGMQIVVANLKTDESVGAWLVDPRVLGSRCLSFLFRWVWGRALSLCLVITISTNPRSQKPLPSGPDASGRQGRPQGERLQHGAQ